MGLNFVIPTRTVDIPGNDPLVVRGLSFEDINSIVARHGAILNELFNDMAANAGSVQASTLAGIASEVVNRAPSVTAEVIALAADCTAESETWESDIMQLRKLPIAIQLDAMQKVGELTFGTEGGLKKAWETVVDLLSGLKGLSLGQAA